jgi:hypothetical protein
MSANPEQWAQLKKLASLGSRYQFPRWLPDQPEDFLESSCHFLVDNWNYDQFSRSKLLEQSICGGWFSWFPRAEGNPQQFRSHTFNVPIALILGEGYVLTLTIAETGFPETLHSSSTAWTLKSRGYCTTPNKDAMNCSTSGSVRKKRRRVSIHSRPTCCS